MTTRGVGIKMDSNSSKSNDRQYRYSQPPLNRVQFDNAACMILGLRGLLGLILESNELSRTRGFKASHSFGWAEVCISEA